MPHYQQVIQEYEAKYGPQEIPRNLKAYGSKRLHDYRDLVCQEDSEYGRYQAACRERNHEIRDNKFTLVPRPKAKKEYKPQTQLLLQKIKHTCSTCPRRSMDQWVKFELGEDLILLE